MQGLIKFRLKLDFLINPFYLFCLGFSLSVFLYTWGWSNIFPNLSAGLILFFLLSFTLFIVAGYRFGKIQAELKPVKTPNFHYNDIMFGLIMGLGIVNILFMGYLPVLDRSHNYREFGVPVIDPVFNTLAIFFSVYFLQIFLNSKKKRFLIYLFVIIVLQFLIFRRSTIVWIFTSSVFLLIYHYRRISLLLILIFLISVPVFSYSFGLYGNYRSNLSKSFIIDDLGASETFKNLRISHNHYISYLYVSSPLANLQKNIDEGNGFLNNGNIKNLIFYNIIPESFTARLSKTFNLVPPEISLITPELIVGTFLIVSFVTMGWAGMIIMLVFFFGFIILCLYLSGRWNTFRVITLCILSTTSSLLIFSNFLNRLDVLLMLFIYPVLFHFIYSKGSLEIPAVLSES